EGLARERQRVPWWLRLRLTSWFQGRKPGSLRTYFNVVRAIGRSTKQADFQANPAMRVDFQPVLP
ncbi:MAG: hypothetical protein ACK5FF_11730, partial [Planctomyces sp.]